MQQVHILDLAAGQNQLSIVIQHLCRRRTLRTEIPGQLRQEDLPALQTLLQKRPRFDRRQLVFIAHKHYCTPTDQRHQPAGIYKTQHRRLVHHDQRPQVHGKRHFERIQNTIGLSGFTIHGQKTHHCRGIVIPCLRFQTIDSFPCRRQQKNRRTLQSSPCLDQQLHSPRFTAAGTARQERNTVLKSIANSQLLFLCIITQQTLLITSLKPAGQLGHTLCQNRLLLFPRICNHRR